MIIKKILVFILLMITCSCEYLCEPKLFERVSKLKHISYIAILNEDIWLASVWGTFGKYEQASDQFQATSFSKLPIVEGILEMTLIDKEIWLGLSSSGIVIYNTIDDTFRNYNTGNGLPGFTANGRVYCKVTSIVHDEFEQKIWIGTVDAGLAVYDIKNKNWSIIEDPLVKNISVMSIALNEKIIAVGGKKGLYIYDKERKIWSIYTDLPPHYGLRRILIDDHIYFVIHQGHDFSLVKFNYQINQYEIIIATDGESISGLTMFGDYFIFASTKGITFFNKTSKKRKILDDKYGVCSKNAVSSVHIYGDDMWVLTQEGICKGKTKEVIDYVKKFI